MPVPGGVQGQNPTQGHYQKDFEIFADFMFAFPLRTCPLDERSYGRAHDVKYTSRPRRRNALHVERLSWCEYETLFNLSCLLIHDLKFHPNLN